MLAEAANTIQGAGSVIDILKRAASATGSDFDYLLATAKRESGLKPEAKSGTSSATGLFQFVEQTWLGLVKEHGARYGMGTEASCITKGADGRYRVDNADNRRAILSLRKDPTASAMMAGEMTRATKDSLEDTLGRSVSGGELYAAHFLGPDAACRLIRMKDKAPQSCAADAFPSAAGANKSVFYRADGSARTVGEVYDWAVKGLRDGGNTQAGRARLSHAGAKPVQTGMTGSAADVVGLLTQATQWKPRGGFFSMKPDVSQAPSMLFSPGVFDVLSSMRNGAEAVG